LSDPDFPSATRFCKQRRVVYELENVPRFWKEDLARWRQLDGSACSLKQFHCQHMFKNLDLPAERRFATCSCASAARPKCLSSATVTKQRNS